MMGNESQVKSETSVWQQKFHGKWGICLSAAGILLLAVFLFGIYLKFRPQAVLGDKEISIEIVYAEQETEHFTIRTDAEYLEQAIESCDDIVIEGNRTPQFGLMIESVNGVRAEYHQDHAYWSLELDGVLCNYGVSQQPVQDGEHYRLVYTRVNGS